MKTNDIYTNAENTLEKIRNRNRKLTAERESEISEKIPAVSLIKQDFLDSVLQASKKEIAKIERTTKDNEFLRTKHKKTNKKIVELLEEQGYSKDYLDPVYDCSLCSDSGYIKGSRGKSRCSCFYYHLMREIYSIPELTLADNISFDSFDSSLFEGFDNALKKSKSEYMNSTKDILTDFCDDTKYINYYIFGKTGTGKTFFLVSMAKKLFNNQVPSLYITANNLFKITQEYKAGMFSDEKPDPEMYNFIYSAKVLLIDDLGTESPTASKYAELFDILNIRNQNKRSTIIASNLAPHDLNKTYDERIYSRVIGSFESIKLQSEDIRVILKRKGRLGKKGH